MTITTVLLAIQVAQVQPSTTPTTRLAEPPVVAHEAQAGRKRQIETNARALLAHAQAFNNTYTPAPGRPSKAELDAAINDMKGSIDSMSEMGEMESLRLQMSMDRTSKMMSTLSNVLKKAGDTDDSIVQNLK